MSKHPRWAGVATASATIAVMAAGCGSSSSSLVSKTPSQILAAAEAAIKGATSYEISGSGGSSGITGFDLKVVGTDISGSYTLSGTTVDLLDVASTICIKAPVAFYTAEGASAAGAALLGGVWVEIPASSSYASKFSSLSNITDISSKLTTTATFTSDGTGTVNGQSVVLLKDSSGDVVGIATSGTPYPLQLTSTGSNAGTYDLSNWNSLATFTAPPNPVTLP
jgi:hypothetical protein